MIEESSARIDQRKPDPIIPKNPVLAMMEAKLANHYLEEEKRRKVNMVMQPVDFSSVKQNAIELNYDILEVLGLGARGKTIVKKIRHRALNVLRVLKVISKSKY